MANRRTQILVGMLVVVVAVFVVRWIMDDSVTLDFRDAPVSKVIKSIESQGKVRIVSNVDPATKVTIIMKKASVYDAMDTLATRLDGDLRLAYIAAPSSGAINEALNAFVASSNPGGWTAFSGGWGGGGPMGGGGDSVADPRSVEWVFSEMPDRNLQSIINQGAQKTGATFAVPTDWNPVVGKLPASATTQKMAQAIASAAKGSLKEVFLMTIRPPRSENANANADGGGQRGEDRGGYATIFSSQRGNRQNVNPEWAADRAKAQIALLPKEEQAVAQQQFTEMQQLFASTRNLPAEERRAKFEEVMNKPEVQAAIEERQSARDAKSTPEQREQRYRRYIDRKQSAQGAGTKG